MAKRGAAASGYNWARANLITQAGVLAKRANQRLRELETQKVEGSSNAYRFVERGAKEGKFWAAKGTQKKSAGKIKFNTNFRSMSDENIQKEMKLLRQFLNAPTSRTKGVRKKVEKLTKKFNENTGLGYSEEQFEELMREDRIKELFKIFASSAIIQMLADNPEAAANYEDVLTALENAENKSISEMDFLTIENAFESWQAAEEESTDADTMEYLFNKRS